MTSKISHIPIYEHRESEINAQHFNTVRIALNRIAKLIRIELPELRTLDLILDADEWIVVDHSLNDIPVVAWTDFQVQHRDNLHQPIKCSLNLYHTHADIILEKVINSMEQILHEKLTDEFLDEKNIIEFRPHRNSSSNNRQ